MTSFVLQGHIYNSREEKMTAISVSRRFQMVYLLDQQSYLVQQQISLMLIAWISFYFCDG